MTYAAAIDQLHRGGCKYATGDALRAMYADLISSSHGGKPEHYYASLQDTKDDADTFERTKSMLRDRATAWDVLMGVVS